MLASENPLSILLIYFSISVLIYAASLYLRERSFVHTHLMKKRRGITGKKKRPRSSSSTSGNAFMSTLRILFVIAHPDDECMFFGPSLLHFVNNKDTSIMLLCLSSGNFYGEGDRRRNELTHSCEIFGMNREKVFIIDHEGLPDDPSLFWDVNLVASTILKIVNREKIDQIITFDHHGASSHRNHISVYRGVRHLVGERLLPKGTQAFSLETVSFLRHYLSFLDLPFSLVMAAVRGSRIILSSPVDVWTAQRAMRAHWSQFVWFRILNIMFSRYLVVNTLRPITRQSPT